MNNKKYTLLDKIEDYSLERIFEEQEKILEYQKKAIEMLDKVFDDKLVDKNSLLMSKSITNSLAKLGYLLEKNENINTLEELKENESEIDSLIGGVAEKLNLDFNPEPEVVLLNENLIEQELIFNAKSNGNNKEAILDGAYQNENGQVAASLVVDLKPEKIKESVSALNDRLNPLNKYPAPNFNHKKESKKDLERKKIEELYVNNFIAKQTKGIALDTETFSHTNTQINFKLPILNIKSIRDKSIGLTEDKPNAVIGSSGLITERRKLT